MIRFIPFYLFLMVALLLTDVFVKSMAEVKYFEALLLINPNGLKGGVVSYFGDLLDCSLALNVFILVKFRYCINI